MTGITLLTSALILLVVGAILTALLSKSRLACGLVAFVTVLIASIWVTMTAWHALTVAPVKGTVLLTIASLNSSLVFTVDGLSAIFLLVTSLVAVCTTLYSIRYMRIYQRYSLVRYYPLLLLFFASVISVVSVHNMLFFLVFWEFMTLTSYVLVVFETDNAAAQRAGLRYFIATHIATVCMLLATVVLYARVGSFDFAALQTAMGGLMATSPALVHLLLGLFVIGFATKAGILPFGFWLPDAYPAAPTGASAAFAGTMTKLGVYGIVRVFTMFLPMSHSVTVWGIIIAVIGTISLFVAALTALQQSDSRRLISFNIISSVGYMWLAVGTGLALLRISPPLATVALLAGLFHIVNGACYGSLLFLTAGASRYRTGTCDLEKAGGLMHVMPVTAAAAIVASLSIAGVPPFSGFSSKWLIFQSSIVGGFEIPLLVFLAIVAIFISAVVLACFLRFLGTLFLGKLRVSPEVERREVPVTMVVPQVVIGIFCILFGVLPVVAMEPLHRAVSGMLPEGYSPTFASLFGSSPLTINLNISGASSGAWGAIGVLIAFAGCLVLAYLISRMGGAQTRKVPMWLCGEEHPFAEVRYPVHSFLLPFNRLFANIYPSIPMPRLPRPSAILRALNIDNWLYYPGLRLGERIIQAIRVTHAGVPQLYMLWVIVGAALAVIVLFAM